MAGLTGKTIAATYHSILKVSTSDNLNFSDTLRDIVDGEDTVSCLKLATDKVQFTLGTDSGDDFKITDGSSTLLLVEGDTKDVTILDNLILDSDDCKIYFGDDQEIILDHDADIGLAISGVGSTTGFLINNAATDGDPWLAFGLSGTHAFTMGVDDGDGDKFKIGTTAIGTGTVFTISSGSIGIGTDTPVAEISGTILHIHDSDDEPAILNLTGGAGTDNSSIGEIHFSDPDNRNDRFVLINASADGTNGGQLSFWTQPTGGGTIADRMRILESGNVGIGTNAPAKLFCVEGNQASDYVARIFNDGNNANRYGLQIICGEDSGDGTLINFEDGDGTSQGAITFTGATVAYGTFTANHNVALPSEDNSSGYDYGTLVETTEIFYKQKEGIDTERGILYRVQKTSSAYSKSILGAYSTKYEDNYAAANSTDGNLHQVYVLGDGHILCNGEKGNISIGDGICSSSSEGEGMKADKTCMIIGIAQEDVSFSGSESKLVPVQYQLTQWTPWD